MTQTAALMRTCQQMREAFDHGFALPIRTHDEAWQDLLLIRLGALPHAVLMNEVAGLQRAAGITPLPSPLPALLGMAGHKGRVLPVYDLALLLGLPPTRKPSWQIVTRAPAVILAIDEFERHVRSPTPAIAIQPDAAPGAHIGAHLHTEEGRRPIVCLPAVLRSVQSMAHDARQER